MNILGLYSIIVDYCYNIRDASIISISENSNITDAYLSYELFFCFTADRFLQDGSYQVGRAYHSTHEKVTVTANCCHQAMSQVAQMRITSAPRDDDLSDEDVIVVTSDDTTLTLSHDHSLLTASSCVKLTSARMQC